MRLIDQRPYIATPVSRIVFIERPGCSSIGVDEKWRCYYDEQWCREYTDRDGLAFILYHGVMHLIREHPRRGKGLEPERANIAMDFAINSVLCEELPDWAPRNEGGGFKGAHPEQLGLPTRKAFEWYYERLPKQPSDQLAQALGKAKLEIMAGDCGSCASGSLGDDEDGQTADGDEVPGVGEIEAKAVIKQTAEEIASGKYAGTAPAHLRVWAEGQLKPAKIAWEKELQSKLLRSIGRAAGKVNYTYAKPSRRDDDFVIFPAMYRPEVFVGLIMDTSASMKRSEKRKALSEINGVFKRAGVGRARFVALDTVVGSDSMVRDVSQVKTRLVGGGGTDMRVGLRHMRDTGVRPSVVIVFTDGVTPWPYENEFPFEIIACIVAECSVSVPDFIRTVHVDKGDLQ